MDHDDDDGKASSLNCAVTFVNEACSSRSLVAKDKKLIDDAPNFEEISADKQPLLIRTCHTAPSVVIMPKKGSTSKKAAMMTAEEETNDRHQDTQQPDIVRQEPPLPLKPLRRVGLGFLGLIGFLVSLVAGIIVLPLLIVVVVVFVIVPRLVVQAVIWIHFRSQGIRLLPISASLSASGYEFYTVVVILRGECRKLTEFRSLFQSLVDAKVGQAPKYPGLGRKLVTRLGFNCWEEGRPVDVSNHVNLLEDEDPEGLSQSRLFQLLQNDFKYGSFKVTRADAPQWEALVIPRFQYDVQVADEEDGLVLLHQEMEYDEIPEDEVFYAVAFRANAAVLNKQETLRMFREDFMDKRDIHPREQLNVPRSFRFNFLEHIIISLYSLLLTGQVVIAQIWRGVPFSFGEFKMTRPLRENYWMGGKAAKHDAFHLHATRTMSLGGIQTAKNVSRTSVTSVLVSCAGGAARNMLLSMDKRLPTEMRFSIKQYFFGSSTPTTFNCILPSDPYTYPIDRLGHAFFTVAGNRHDLYIHAAKKSIVSALLWVTGAMSAKGGRAMYRWLHNVHILFEIWDLGGKPFSLFHGEDVVVDLFAWNGIDATWADFGITMTTYAGRVKANIIADQGVLGCGMKMRKNMIADEFLEEYTQIAFPCDIKPKYLYKPVVLGRDELF